MRPTPRVMLFAIGLAALPSPAIAQQEAGERAPPAASVTLDQLPAVSDVHASSSGPTDLEVPQSTGLSPAAAVAAANVATAGDRAELATSPVVGIDRCNPAAARGQPALCRQRLETRAGQFAGPQAPSVNSEGRLLVLLNRDGRATGGSVSVAQRADPNDLSGQLAGALETIKSATDSTTPNGGSAPGAAGALPNGVPPVIVLPTK